MELTKIPLPFGEAPGFVAGFPGHLVEELRPEPKAILSFAAAGDMKYRDPSRVANRERFLHLVGMDPSKVLGLELAHSRAIVFHSPGEAADRPGTNGADGADGMILDAPVGPAAAGAMAASVTVADCMPIWILDRQSGAYGILHSGWRGTGILAVAVRALLARGSRPSSIALILGPAIGPCCYTVSEERAALFSAEFGPGCVHSRGGSPHLDLRAANVSIALSCGVGHVLSIEACTSCDERLGSYRRQGGAGFTRMMAACGFSPRPEGILDPAPA